MKNRLLLCGACILLLSACATTAKKNAKTLDAANAHVELAFSYIESGDLPAANEQLQKSEKIAKNNAQLDHGYAIYYQRLGEYARADRYFAEALKKVPDDPSINNNYGVLLTAIEKYDDAYLKFQAAYSNRDYPFRYSAYENYGDVARLLGDYDKALEAYQQALSLKANWFILHLKIAQSYYSSAKFLPAYESLEIYMRQLESLNLSPSREDLELGIALASAIKDYETVDSYQELLQQQTPQTP